VGRGSRCALCPARLHGDRVGLSIASYMNLADSPKSLPNNVPERTAG
jgi:hypothetical protein